MSLVSRASLGLAPLSLVLATAACGDTDDGSDSGSDASGSAIVNVDDNFFEPEEAEVGAGDTVTWEWVGSEPHNIKSDDFESDTQQAGTFEHTFYEAGSYEYVCTIHPGMKGAIDVS